MNKEPMEGHVQIDIKSPSLKEALVIVVSYESTVLELKQAIQLLHHQQPVPTDQRIIFRGKLLDDKDIIRDILIRADNETTPTFHLVVKPSLSTLKRKPTPAPVSQAGVAAETPEPSTVPMTHTNSNIPPYPPMLPGGYQVVAINGQYYLAPVLVLSQPLPHSQQYLSMYPPITPNISDNIPLHQQPLSFQPQPVPPQQQQPQQQQPFMPGFIRPNAQGMASLWLAVKLAVVLAMVCQGANIESIIFFHMIALVFFLYQTGRLRIVFRRVRIDELNRMRGVNGNDNVIPRVPPTVPHIDNNENRRNEGENSAENSPPTEPESSNNPTPDPRPPTWIEMLKRGLSVFVLSLWPNYGRDPRIAQAFENDNDQQREEIL
ncbi:hypothetical protein BDB01DRAFT_846772 [Pilobolus umbonatus]|nr:hypothetical protein BDB01DRAFT_846772 [Pilobolus umbonatus]